MSVLSACGGGSGDSSGGSKSCGATPTCGGALDGTWRLASTCVEGDLNAAFAASDGSLPSACNTLFQGFTLDAQGTVGFANNQETDNVTLTLRGTAAYTPACINALAGATVSLTASMCSSLESGLASKFDTATCALVGGNCNCAISKSQVAPTAPQSYTTSGGTVTYTDPASSPMNYCVTGTTMTVRQEVGGIPNIHAVNVLDKI